MSKQPEYRPPNPFGRALFIRGHMPEASVLQRMHDALANAIGRGCQIYFSPTGGLVVDVQSSAWAGFVKYGVDRYYDPDRIPETGDRRGSPIVDQTTVPDGPRCLVFSRQAPHVTWRDKVAEPVPQPIDEEWYDEENIPAELHCPAFGNG